MDEPSGDLRPLAAFFPVLASADFTAGKWVVPSRNGDVISLPFFSYSIAVMNFVKSAYANKWIVKTLDWSRWIRGDEARALINDPAAIAGATPQQLFHLLTAYIRGDRFCEGTLADAFESGLIRRIVERARDIVDGAP